MYSLNNKMEKIKATMLNVVKSYEDDKKFDLEKYLFGLSQLVNFPS